MQPRLRLCFTFICLQPIEVRRRACVWVFANVRLCCRQALFLRRSSQDQGSAASPAAAIVSRPSSPTASNATTAAAKARQIMSWACLLHRCPCWWAASCCPWTPAWAKEEAQRGGGADPVYALSEEVSRLSYARQDRAGG